METHQITPNLDLIGTGEVIHRSELGLLVRCHNGIHAVLAQYVVNLDDVAVGNHGTVVRRYGRTYGLNHFIPD